MINSCQPLLMATPINADLDETYLTPRVAEQFRIAFGLPREPQTLETWVELTFEILAEGFRNNRDADLAPNSSHHSLWFDDTVYHTTGLFEALVLGFIVDGSSIFQLRSQSPGRGSTIEVDATRNHFSVNPENAVTSFGVSNDIVAPDYFDVPAYIAYYRFNQYTYAFPNHAAYDAWANRAEDVVSMALPMNEAISLSCSITEKWVDHNMAVK